MLATPARRMARYRQRSLAGREKLAMQKHLSWRRMAKTAPPGSEMKALGVASAGPGREFNDAPRRGRVLRDWVSLPAFLKLPPSGRDSRARYANRPRAGSACQVSPIPAGRTFRTLAISGQVSLTGQLYHRPPPISHPSLASYRKNALKAGGNAGTPVRTGQTAGGRSVTAEKRITTSRTRVSILLRATLPNAEILQWPKAKNPQRRRPWNDAERRSAARKPKHPTVARKRSRSPWSDGRRSAARFPVGVRSTPPRVSAITATTKSSS